MDNSKCPAVMVILIVASLSGTGCTERHASSRRNEESPEAETAKQAPHGAKTSANNETPLNESDSAGEPGTTSVGKTAGKHLPTIADASLDVPEKINFLRQEDINYTFSKGKTVGHVPGVVKEYKSGRVLASYDLTIIETLPGGYLACKGTYWLPYPVPKPDLSWETVPPTVAFYSVHKSKYGVIFTADKSVTREHFRKHAIKTEAPMETRLVFTSDLEPAFFGKGSIHLPETELPEPTIPDVNPEAEKKGKSGQDSFPCPEVESGRTNG